MTWQHGAFLPPPYIGLVDAKTLRRLLAFAERVTAPPAPMPPAVNRHERRKRAAEWRRRGQR